MAGLKQAVLVLATLATIVGISSAATLTVGDKTGWTIPSPASLYTSWAAKQTFQVGDVLVFNFPAGMHTVAEVSKSAYDSCSTASPLSAVKTTAPANITITSPGTHYFICTIPTHCTNGQKLSVVATGPSKKTPSPSTAPTTAPTTSPSGSATIAPSANAPSTTTTTTAAGGPATPPSGNFAAPTTVGLLSLVSVVAAVMLF